MCGIKLKSLFVIAALICFQNLYGQYYNQTSAFLNANSQWIFGDFLGFNKKNNTPFAVPGFSSTGLTMSVADPVTGQLLFYSNGVNCWTASGQIMPNGANLGGRGNGGRTQPVCAVPFINETGKYYVFALDDPFSNTGYAPNGKGKLYYSILDMSLNSGAGDIVPGRKAILLDTLIGSNIIAIPGNNCDIWVMTHGLYESSFKAYHITAAGLNTNPVVSMAGPGVYQTPIVIGNDPWRQGYVQGQMAISPDRSRIAIGVICMQGFTLPAGVKPLGFVVAKFDASTGVVSDAIQHNKGDIHVYGIGFSPDNTKLYANIVWSDNSVRPGVHQFDISTYDSAAVAASAALIFSNNSVIKQKSFKLYDDTLYVSDQSLGGTPTISRINNPNLSGTACNYEDAAISFSLNGMIVQGLTNDVVYPMPPDTTRSVLMDTLFCSQVPTLILSATGGLSDYKWDDGSVNTQRIVNDYGVYWVSAQDGCNVREDSFYVKGATYQPKLGNDVFICNTDSIVLRPEVYLAGASYSWQDGSRSDSFTAKQSGDYIITASMNGCTWHDTVRIDLIDIAQDLGEDNIACDDIPVSLVLKANIPAEAVVLWNDGSNGQELSITQPGSYWVQVRRDRCTDVDTIVVERNMCDCEVFAPNAFSPNGDGRNDLFRMRTKSGCQVNGYSLLVFNRWGQKVYSTANQTEGWDGSFGGMPCDAGSYFYTVEFNKGTLQLPYQQKGELTLLR